MILTRKGVRWRALFQHAKNDIGQALMSLSRSCLLFNLVARLMCTALQDAAGASRVFSRSLT